MAKAIIKYNLSDPDDLMDFKRACKANHMSFALFELLYNTKKGIGYEMEGKEMDKYDALELVFERIHEIMREHNIKIDEIVN